MDYVFIVCSLILFIALVFEIKDKKRVQKKMYSILLKEIKNRNFEKSKFQNLNDINLVKAINKEYGLGILYSKQIANKLSPKLQ